MPATLTRAFDEGMGRPVATLRQPRHHSARCAGGPVAGADCIISKSPVHQSAEAWLNAAVCDRLNETTITGGRIKLVQNSVFDIFPEGDQSWHNAS